MSWRAQFDEIRSRMIEYNASIEYIDDDEDDEHREMPPEELVSILHEACALLRRAEEEHSEELEQILTQVEGLVNRAIARGYAEGLGDGTGLRSFAHSEDGMVSDPWYRRLYLESKADVYKDLMAHLGVATERVDEFISDRTSPLEPWSAAKKPHPQTTKLSRFRPEVVFPSPTTHPLANVVFQARCEITNFDLIRQPGKLVLSTDGTFMAMTTRSGYKDRNPLVCCWSSPENPDGLAHKNFTPPIAHLITDHVLDESRHLLFIADQDRVKSFTYGSGLRATHTLDATSGYHHGLLSVLPNGRIARSGKGSAMIWNIDELDTHFVGESPDFRRIGGDYPGFRDSSRDVECNKELSKGNPPHTTVPFADPDSRPHTWQYHVPSGYMLIGQDPYDNERCDCVALDLEHGGKNATRFIGHGDRVETISLCEEDPRGFVTASADGYARLWDMRQHLPVLTFESEKGEGVCSSALYVHLNGLPAVFTGGTDTQSIRFWDIRARKLVYELSTGNNAVASMAWDKTRSILYASTEANHRPGPTDRIYRKARKVKREPQSAEQDDSMTDEDKYYDDIRWPYSAYHKEEYFGEVYNAGGKIMFRYSFKEDVNMDVIPPYGQSTMGGFF